MVAQWVGSHVGPPIPRPSAQLTGPALPARPRIEQKKKKRDADEVEEAAAPAAEEPAKKKVGGGAALCMAHGRGDQCRRRGGVLPAAGLVPRATVGLLAPSSMPIPNPSTTIANRPRRRRRRRRRPRATTSKGQGGFVCVRGWWWLVKWELDIV